MKYRTFALLITMILCFACEDEGIVGPASEATYVQDNIFGCDEFEVMLTENQFSSNRKSDLEVFNQYFVFEAGHELVIKDGFNGPTLHTRDMVVEDFTIFNDHLMICAEEGLYRMNISGEIDTITTQRCYSMTLDGQNRLILQGVFGTWQNNNTSAYFNFYEFKNNTLVPFAPYPSLFNCVSIKLTGGIGESLYAISCHNEIAYYKNGVVQAVFEDERAPLFAYPGFGENILHAHHKDGLIAITLVNHTFRMYKLVGTKWEPIYHLSDENPETEKAKEVVQFFDYNMIIHNDYLYTLGISRYTGRMANSRFDISGDEQKSWEDVELFQIPGLDSRDIIDIVIASDGHAYATLNSRKIVRISC